MNKFTVYLRTALYLMALALAFHSCNNDDDPVLNDKGQVLALIYDNAEQDDAAPETKTAPKTVWLNGDAIGVFCVEPGKSLGKVNYASNKKYVYNGTKFEPASDADKIWISKEGTFKFYAYYPYSTSQSGVDIDATALKFSVAADQTSDNARTNSDILGGQSTDVDNGNGQVKMSFYHLMSDIRFRWTRSSSQSNETVNALFATGAVVNLAGAGQPTCRVDGSSVGNGIKMNIKEAYNSASGRTEFQAFVPPTTIKDGQDLFVPYDKDNKALAAIQSNLGGQANLTLEEGHTYDLAGNMFTIIADVRRNGDLVTAGCDSYDGCVVAATGGGDSQNLKQFTGRYLEGRECQIQSEMGTGLPAGTQFIGWFELQDDGTTWTKIADADETYKFEVNKDRRLQARYENYVYTPWEIHWNAPVTVNSNVPTYTILATNASEHVLSLTATRTVTLDGELVNDPDMNTRDNSQITLRVIESEYVPTGNLNRFNEPAWGYVESTKTITSTRNSDEASGTQVARKLVAHVVIDGQDMYTTADKGGALDNPVDHSKVPQSEYLLTVTQEKGTQTTGENDNGQWSVLIENVGSVNQNMDAKGTANGATKGTFDAYIYLPRKVAGEVVEVRSVKQGDIKSAFSSNGDNHWSISSEAKTRTFTYNGHSFTNIEGAAFKVDNKNNCTESVRSQTITINSTESGSASGTTPVRQNAGEKTNKTWTDWVITGNADPTELEVIRSTGTNNTSVITVDATRDMNYDWNNISSDKGKDEQKGQPTITITKGGDFATLDSDKSGGRVSVENNYDQSTLGQKTPDREIVVTATIPNSENGHGNSTKDIVINQKGGTVTETRDTGTGQSIATSGNIDADGGDTQFIIVNPTRVVHVILDGTNEIGSYRETGELTGVTSSDAIFSIPTTLDKASADPNKGAETDVFGTWTNGSVTISGGTIPVGGASRNVSITVPQSQVTHRYNTSERSATLTATWTFKNDTGAGQGDGATVTATCTVRQNGTHETISTRTEYFTIKSVTASNGASYSGGTSSTGTVTYGDNHGTPVDHESDWSGGSVSLSRSSFGRIGGTATISVSAPSRSTWQEYNTSARTTTVTATFERSTMTDKTASDQVTQSGSSAEVPNSRDTEYASNPTYSTSLGSISGTTLSVSDSTSTWTSYSISNNGSLSISGSPIAAGGGTATASTSLPDCSWTEYYNSVNNSGRVTATWSGAGISRSASFTQTADGSTTGRSGSGTASAGTIQWPGWCPGGRAGENTGSAREGTVSVTFSYNGETSTATATVRQNGAVITYGDYRITVSPTSMTWAGDDGLTARKSYTVTAYRTEYVNGKKGSEETTTASNISASCTSGFGGNESYIWPSGTNDTKDEKTGTATISANVGGTTCKATISLKQDVQDWNVTEK